MKKKLVFWKHPVPDFLSEYFGETNIHLSISEFSKEGIDKININYDGILILCELNKDEKNEHIKLQDMYGIKLAQDLRLMCVNIPILFSSFLTRKMVFANRPEREIINTIGHNFLQLPTTSKRIVEEMKKILPLNKLELYDIQNTYCRKEGMVRELAHRLSDFKYFDLNVKSQEEIKEYIYKAVLSIADVYNDNPKDFLEVLGNKYSDLNDQNINEIITEIGRYGERIISEHSPILFIESFTNTKSWKLLWLDDEANTDHKLILLLKKHGVEVILCPTAEIATKYLEEDWGKDNKINVILGDYRLYENIDEVKVHQKVQGYTFLNKIAESGRMIRLAALSALPRKFLLHSFKNFNIRTEIFSKRDYLEDDNTIKLLCDELIDIGDENEEAIVRLPRITSEYWKYFEPFYSYHRNSFNYMENELYISEKAKIYCDGLIQDEYKFELSGYTVALGRDLPTKEAKAKKKVKNDKDEKRKGGRIYEKEEKIVSIKDPSKEKYYEEFINKMICRRVAIWYTQYNPNYTLKDVHRILKGKKFTGTETVLASKNQINTNLALKLSEFPWNMTVEEKRWLVYDMKIIGIGEKEKQEESLLSFSSEQVVLWLNNNQAFSEFHNTKKLNTFSHIRKILNQVSVKIHEHLDNLNSLLCLITTCKTEIARIVPENESKTETVLLFEKYLKLLENKLRRINKIPIIQKITNVEWEVLKSRITKKALGKLTSTEDKQTLESIAWLFFNELQMNNKTYNSENIYLTELMKEFNKQKFTDPNIIGFDDLRISSKRGTDDNEDDLIDIEY